MNRTSMLQWVRSQRWAMRPEAYAAMIMRLSGAEGSDMPTAAPEEPEALQTPTGIAVVPMRGVLLPHPGMYWLGGPEVFMEPAAELLEELADDDAVGAIVLDWDSPGGLAAGTPEFAERIYELRGKKPLVSVANPEAASAALFAAVAAERFYVTPSGDVGSIGTIMMHQDISEALREFGVKVTVIATPEYKGEGNPFEPLSDETREYFQAGVEEHYAMFRGAVARFRGVTEAEVEERFGRGRMLSAAQAAEVGLVDGVMRRDQVIAMLQAELGFETSTGASARARRPAAERRDLPENAEIRSIAIEVRADGSGAEERLHGVGVIYDSPSRDLGGWTESFAPGAFQESLGSPELLVVWQHDRRYVFGRVGAGTAGFSEEGGLKYWASPPAAQWAADAMESIRRGDVHRSSFVFVAEKDRWERREGRPHRVVERARLIEAGPQTYAAYEDTEAAVRSLQAWRHHEALVEVELARQRFRFV